MRGSKKKKQKGSNAVGGGGNAAVSGAKASSGEGSYRVIAFFFFPHLIHKTCSFLCYSEGNVRINCVN